jgi:Family of unknown function (DUF5682)
VTQPGAVTVFGVRHHGPGSARSLRAALAQLRPDIVLVEGPPEADGLVELTAHDQMQPPVALLGYVPGQPGRAAFWPFAAFSPEWQAITYALGAGIPVRFCDLPAAHLLAEPPAATAENPSQRKPGEIGLRAAGPASPSEDPGQQPLLLQSRARIDPIGCLASIAGYDDPERWWEDVVEHSRAGEPAVFAGVAEAMAVLREQAFSTELGDMTRDARREAAMRKTLRAAFKAGYGRVAVVCGAWHVPALLDRPPAAADGRILRGLPKVKVALTWVPWTYRRLASWSGYGAGIRSPGWYHHLFESGDRPIEGWLTMAARVLRDEGIGVSPAHVIESVRLAQGLAALRNRPLAGLEEVTEAARAVLCEGSELAVDLIQRRLVVGERLGHVPDATPMVPLQRDLQNQQRRLRLRPEAAHRDLDLDLRKPNDLARSHLLHRLTVLDVDWGSRQRGRANLGTFRETWLLAWRPELDLALIEASMWGTTVAAAAAGRMRALAGTAQSLADLTRHTEHCLLAGLSDAVPDLVAAVRERAAVDTDVTHLMAALPALVRAARYGDVRGTDPGRLGDVAREMIVRICTGLPLAVASLDEDAERKLQNSIDSVHSSVGLLADAECRNRWESTLARLAERDNLAPLIGGRLTRLLLDAGRISADAGTVRMSRELSPSIPPARAASWTEGFLAGSGLLLIHDDVLLNLVDGWLSALTGDAFLTVLPALRRTFADFTPPERRAIGEKAARLDGSGQVPRAAAAHDFDLARATGAMRAVAAILGLPARDSELHPPPSPSGPAPPSPAPFLPSPPGQASPPEA